MGKKRTVEEEINLFLQMWGCDEMVSFLKDIVPLFELYDVNEEDDWVREETGGDFEYVRNIRLIRTVYLVSKIAAHHAGDFCKLNIEFRDLWKRMEKHGIGTSEV